MPHQWSEETVVERILALHRSGKKLNSDHMQKCNSPLYQAACNHWGGWRQAIEGAGLKYDDVRILQRNRPVWSQKKILAAIRKRRRNKEPLNSNYIQTKENRLYGAATKYFGGWAQAVAAAGLDYAKLRKKTPVRSWSRAAIVAEIIRRHGQELSIRGEDVSREDSGLYHAAKRHLGKGGWAKARTLAGFDPVDPRPFKIWNERTVCEEILRLHENGIPLHTGFLQKSNYSHVMGAGRVVFGSWGKAIRAAGLDYSTIRKQRNKWWTKPRVLMCIKSLDRRGIRLSHKEMSLTQGPLLSSAILLFGSWSQAVEAADIDYRKHSRTWSTKAWLRRMSDSEYKSRLS